MEELSYSFHLSNDKNKTIKAKQEALNSPSGTTSKNNNAIQNIKHLGKVNHHNLRQYDNKTELITTIKGSNDIIKDVSFEGEACVISISSTNILTNLLIGKTKEEGIYLIDNYLKMINEEEYDKDVLKELLVFDDTSKQPSRIKCATLSANGIKDYLEKENHS